MERYWAIARVLAVPVSLVLIAGATHRWAHGSRARLLSVYRPPVNPLSDLPLTLGAFALNRELPLAPDVLAVADVDTYVHREYANSTTGESVQLYVGYWGRQNVGIGHGPEVCFPAVGWEREGGVKARPLAFVGEDGVGHGVPMASYRFVHDGPRGRERIAVGFLVAVDGGFRASSRDVFLHRPPRGTDSGFLAHVQVVTPATRGTWQDAEVTTAEFMSLFLPHVSKCLFDPRRDSVTAGLQSERELAHGG